MAEETKETGAVEEVEEAAPRTALDAMNELERKIQLEGAKDPAAFQMPGGGTLADIQKKLLDQQVAEGKESAKSQRKRLHEQYRENTLLESDARILLNPDNGQLSVAATADSVPESPDTVSTVSGPAGASGAPLTPSPTTPPVMGRIGGAPVDTTSSSAETAGVAPSPTATPGTGGTVTPPPGRIR